MESIGMRGVSDSKLEISQTYVKGVANFFRFLLHRLLPHGDPEIVFLFCQRIIGQISGPVFHSGFPFF